MNTLLSPAEWTLLQEIVNTAAELAGDERQAYLARTCAGDTRLRARVDSLLAAISAETFLGSAVERAASITAEQGLPAAGSRVGPYRIESTIGRGGMGIVFEAVRDDDQYRKRVAIKVAASGLLSRDLLQRFRNERQILAHLDHPHIARLLDGGATEAGLPYVVMELIEGEPIDQYCYRQQLSSRQILALFVRVARAVHYAHQKLVVHRDLKPLNILVTTEGEPKLLDFGIAKLLDLDQGLAQTMTSDMGRMLTPEFASPEQIRNEPVSTATDVYQLGVVLFKLLTGQVPFSAATGSFTLLEKKICEQEPPRPGVNSDLDRVILKALAKEPARRYSSAEELAADIERYLAGYPVLARPASWSYVTWRFIRRHRFGSLAALLFLLLLLISVAAMSVLYRRARTEAETANQVTDFVVGLFDSNDPRNGRGDKVTARDLLDRGVPRIDESLKGSPEVRARLLDTVGGLYTRLGLFQQAQHLLEEAMDLRKNVLRREDADLANTISNLADNVANLGDLPKAENLYRDALRISRQRLGENDDNVAAGLSNLSSVLFDEGKLQEAEAMNLEAVERRKRLLGVNAPETLITMNNLETVYMEEGEYDNAEALAREVLERRRQTESESHPDLGYSWGNLAHVLEAVGRYPEAEEAAGKSLEVRTKAYPEGHPQLEWGRVIMANVLSAAGKPDQALPFARQALDGLARSVGAENRETAQAREAFGTALLGLGKAAEARLVLLEALAARERILQPGSTEIAGNLMRLAEADAALNDWPAAQNDAAKASAIFVAALGKSNVRSAAALGLLAEIEAEEGQLPQARVQAESVLGIDRSRLPALHPQTASAESTLGWVLWKEGNAAQGAPLMESAYQMDRQVFRLPARAPAFGRVAERWIAYLGANGKGDEATWVEAESGLKAARAAAGEPRGKRPAR